VLLSETRWTAPALSPHLSVRTARRDGDDRNQRIGFVFQQFSLLPTMSALSNVELPRLSTDMPAGERRDRAQSRLAAVSLESREDHRPPQLSGRQQQRVAIARTLVNDRACFWPRG
jgi:ABC-type lipoprotein export system ATPase subunit